MNNFKETSFREKQKANQEHITPPALREFIASHLPIAPLTIFDGAIGSGQILQFINAEKITGVDVNKDSLEACKQNFKNIELVNDCFFSAMTEFKENQFEMCISNFPFSLKVDNLSEKSKNNILNDILLNRFFKKNKLIGVCDFLFILKMFQFSERYCVFVAFPGIAYRQNEKDYREYLTPFVKEMGIIENCNFETTNISILYLLLDKQHNGATKTFRLDFKTNKKIEKSLILDFENWEVPAFDNEIKKMTTTDFVNLEIEARKTILTALKNQLEISKLYSELNLEGFPPFDDFINDVVDFATNLIKKELKC